jgi:acyl-CoA thioesterase
MRLKHPWPNIRGIQMDGKVQKAIFNAVANEPYAQQLNMELIELEVGHSKITMTYLPDTMDNIYGYAHGGVVYALIDEAFETAAQTHGTIAVALNVNVTYVAPPQKGDQLFAEANEISQTRKTATYDIRVTRENGDIIANCQALAYRTGKVIPFLSGD